MKLFSATTMLLVGLVAAGALLFWSRPATADKPGGCGQWEVMLSQPARLTIDAKSLPELGKPIVDQAPPGWEPFAFTPGGQLVFRRCAK